MDDLIFKDIPEEGFDSDSGVPERFSNPTPSRIGTASCAPGVHECDDSRLSNPSSRKSEYPGNSSRLSGMNPSRRTDTETNAYNEHSRASNPVPTRRRSATPFYTNCSEKPDDSANADVYSCPSNSSPKRRKVDKESNAPTVIFVSDENTFSHDESVSRPSNPLPTRRKFESKGEENISFAGKANETYFSETNGRAASNPSPTRRSVKTEDTSAVDTSVDRRMSNYISSIKK